jgi:hypothetical protein
MPEKPTTAAGYPPGQVARVKATCLYLATKLGDLMPELVVVGGLVPSLLIDQEHLPENVTAHAGTMDLDLGLAFALVGEARYQEVAARLRNAGFSPDKNDEGKPTRQRWRISDPPVMVDFLIEPEKSTEATRNRNERRFAKILRFALSNAFVMLAYARVVVALSLAFWIINNASKFPKTNAIRRKRCALSYHSRSIVARAMNFCVCRKIDFLKMLARNRCKHQTAHQFRQMQLRLRGRCPAVQVLSGNPFWKTHINLVKADVTLATSYLV